MKHGWMRAPWMAGVSVASCVTVNDNAVAQGTKPAIAHDAEYYILETQHAQPWAAEDQEINRKLAELRQKYGTLPNIIDIMWDDTAVGEVGIPPLCSL
jgi:hypothetical protein